MVNEGERVNDNQSLINIRSMAKSKASKVDTININKSEDVPPTYQPLPGDTEPTKQEVEQPDAKPVDNRHFLKRLWSNYNGSFMFALGFQYFNTGAYSMIGMSMQYLFLNKYKLDPALATFYITLTNLPWSPKIVYGIVTDCLPICGSGKRAYVFLMGML
jgi:hypothetical protein